MALENTSTAKKSQAEGTKIKIPKKKKTNKRMLKMK